MIFTQPGCAEWQKAGECAPVDFLPTGGPGGLTDDDFAQIVESCAPTVIGLDRWATVIAPSIGTKCENLILSKLPLSDELANPSNSDQRATRSALARAIHGMLFIPLVDTGGFFGSADSKDYCPSMYADYLGAAPMDGLTGLPFSPTRSAYRSGATPSGLHLARFILERTSEFAFKTDATQDDHLVTIASEYDGRITLRPAFGQETNALILASILVHESRHNAEGFEDGSRHVKCEGGDGDGQYACDETMFGSYGAGMAYLDAALRGGMHTATAQGTPLLSWSMILGAYRDACGLYLNRIEEQSDSVTQLFKSTSCTSFSSQTVRNALATAYGTDPVELLGASR